MSSPSRFRRGGAISLGVYGLTLSLIAFWPTPIDRAFSRSLSTGLRWFRDGGVDWMTYTFVESASNVILFVPLGVLLVFLLGPLWWWATVLLGIVTSCLMEGAQLLFLPERYATVVDIYANTLGTIAGTVIGLLLLMIAHLAEGRRSR